MAIYTLDNIKLKQEDRRIVASATIMVERPPISTDVIPVPEKLERFTITLPFTTDPQDIVLGIANHAKQMIIDKTPYAEAFDKAIQFLESKSWEYSS